MPEVTADEIHFMWFMTFACHALQHQFWRVESLGFAKPHWQARRLDAQLRPEELFDANGALHAHIAAIAPRGNRRMSANPHANGGLLLRELKLPDFRAHAVPVDAPGASQGEATRVLGGFLRDTMRLNGDQQNFRVMGPDETVSNRLGALFEVTTGMSTARIDASDDHVAPDGRVPAASDLLLVHHEVMERLQSRCRIIGLLGRMPRFLMTVAQVYVKLTNGRVVWG